MTIKQYVNLRYDADENHGSRIRLEVEADQLGDEDVGRAEWWVEPVGGDNQDLKYLRRNARARMRHRNTRNRRDRFRNTVHLPHVGGDKYQVKCSKRGDRSDPVELEEIETWRKLYYTVHYMNDDCRNFFNALKDKFEDAFEVAFIELEQAETKQTKVDEPRTRSTNSLRHLYDRRPPLADKPFHLRLVVLNDIYDVESNSYTEVTSDRVFVFTSDDPLADSRPIRSVQARRVGTRSWRSVTRHTTKTGDDELTIRLEDDARIARALDDGHDIQVRIRVRERDHYLGHSIGNFCCVRINESGTLAERRTTVLQTLTHEVGHGCQQAVRRERVYNDRGGANGWENNPNWHTDNFGGQGPHCSTNAKLGPDSSTTSGQSYEHDSGTLCTMFYRDDSQVDSDGKFCASCEPRLMRADLGRRSMRRQGWGRY